MCTYEHYICVSLYVYVLAIITVDVYITSLIFGNTLLNKVAAQ